MMIPSWSFLSCYFIHVCYPLTQLFCPVNSNLNCPFVWWYYNGDKHSVLTAISSVISTRCPVNPGESDIGNSAPGDPSLLGDTMVNYSVKVKGQITVMRHRSGCITLTLLLMQMQRDSRLFRWSIFGVVPFTSMPPLSGAVCGQLATAVLLFAKRRTLSKACHIAAPPAEMQMGSAFFFFFFCFSKSNQGNCWGQWSSGLQSVTFVMFPCMQIIRVWCWSRPSLVEAFMCIFCLYGVILWTLRSVFFQFCTKRMNQNRLQDTSDLLGNSRVSSSQTRCSTPRQTLHQFYIFTLMFQYN